MAMTQIPKSNIQPFRKADRFADGMMTVVTRVNNLQLVNLWRLKDNFPTSEFFGQFLWDNDLFDLARFFSRRYWSQNYPAIIEAMRIAGTYESIIVVVTSAMGSGLVTFENPAPSHLRVLIAAGDQGVQAEALLDDGTKAQITVDGPTYPGADLTFAHSTSQLTFAETAKLIELLIPSGVFVEIVSV